MQVPACPGTRVGVPTVFSLVDPDASMSEGRDVEFTRRFTCSPRHGRAVGLSFSFPLFLPCLLSHSLIACSRLAVLMLSVLGKKACRRNPPPKPGLAL